MATTCPEWVLNLLYCIHAEPRLFRWNAGVVEWADPVTPDDWHVVPGQENGSKAVDDGLG